MKLPQITKPTGKMRISSKAKKFVDTLVSSGCSITEASKVAGYRGNSSRVSASKMLRKPEVQEYMAREVQRAFGLSSARASVKLLALSQGAKSEYVQLEASNSILDRAGCKAPEKHQHLVGGDFHINIDLT